MAAVADNCRFFSGALRSYLDKIDITHNALISGDVKTIFRMSDGVSDYWLSWLTDVNCVRSQIAGDTDNRIYWTGDNEPRTTNLTKAITGGGVMPDSCFVLGVSAPLDAPTVTPSGGVGAATSRAYVETFVTPWGEESAPSPVSAVTSGKVDDTWALSALNAAPINTATITAASHASGIVTLTTTSTKHLRAGEEITHASILGMTDLNGNFPVKEVIDATHYTILLNTAQTYTSGGTWSRVAPHNTSGMTRRIYRTLDGEYFFVAELPVGTTTYNDTIADADLGEPIPSVGWVMPPADMKGMIVLPNGYNAAISGNEIVFSVPWQPHAWPIGYRLPCEFEPVAIGSYGSSIVVGSKGLPYVITGTDPSGLSMEETELTEPCLSALGMVDVGVGVIYPSPNGLAFVGAGGAKVVTEGIFSRDEWLPLKPDTLRCDYHNGLVLGWHDLNADARLGFIFDPTTKAFTTTSVPISTSYVDEETNNLYVVEGAVIYQWDAHPYNSLPFDWKSGIDVSKPVNYSIAKIDGDFDGVSLLNDAVAADTAYNDVVLTSGVTDGELNGSMLNEYALNGSLLRGGSIAEYTSKSLRLTLYADGEEKYSRAIENDTSFSLPAGFKSGVLEFRLSGNIPVHGLYVAQSARELRTLLGDQL